VGTESYDELLVSVADPGQRPVTRLKALGKLVDLSWQLGRAAGLRRSIEALNSVLQSNLTANQKYVAHYYLANAWSHIRALERHERPQDWDWQQDELVHEIVNYRLAVHWAREARVPPAVLCPIYTNLGNTFSYVGRFVEAVAFWDAALHRDPAFAMALGNKGFCLLHYARALYDRGQSAAFLKAAHQLLGKAIHAGVEEEATAGFRKAQCQIEAVLKPDYLATPLDTEGFSLGRSAHERAYRRWCLRERLFLNPLNDVGAFSAAAHDCLTTPPMVQLVGHGPYYQGFFNQIKQEFVSARFLHFEGLRRAKPHFSDRGVLLYNTLDYPAYALALEKQKLAFRSAYSVLDKVGFFLNHYLRLGIPETQVSFRKLWYEGDGKKRHLRQVFSALTNWPLRGLFWLAKDLHDDSLSVAGSSEPRARQLAEVRNHLEHKYLKVHNEDWAGPPQSSDVMAVALADTLAYSIRRSVFSELALMTLKLARAALMYLSLGVHTEERRMEAQRGGKVTLLPVALGTWEDGWKT